MGNRAKPTGGTTADRGAPSTRIQHKHDQTTDLWREFQVHTLWLVAAPVRKMILQMHTPARTSQCWSRQTPLGLGVCIWMHLVNGTGNSLSLGQPTPE